MNTESLTLRRPDDWHLHLRDGEILRAVLPYTACVFARAIVMPNLVPPITTVAEALAYRTRIHEALPSGVDFTPLMTCYLTDNTDPDEIRRGFGEGVFAAVKLYPAGATTNSEHGVTDIRRVHTVLDIMQHIGMPLLVHGEVVDPEVDVFDREAVFIDRVLQPVRRDFPQLKIVFEHITTAAAVDYVAAHEQGLGATITPHHLMINRNALFRGGLRPHMYCLPVAKREGDRQALRRAATSGDARFFLGTDSAPHLRGMKECDGGCAGIFNAPVAMQCLAQVFDEERALEQLEGFASLNGPRFYGLAPNEERIVLRKTSAGEEILESIDAAGEVIKIFHPETLVQWRLMAASQARVPAKTA